MTEDDVIRITRRLIDVATREKEMQGVDLLCIGFTFCSTMIEHALTKYPHQNKLEDAKSSIKNSFIKSMIELLDDFEPEEE